MFRQSFVAIALFFSVIVPGLADFEQGMQSYLAGDFVKAYELWKPLADTGDSEAQLGIGNLYSKGQGVRQDFDEALLWYRKSAKQNNQAALYTLGLMYVNGIGGLKKSEEDALEFFTRSGEQGFANAQHVLGFMFMNGIGTKADPVEGYKWTLLAAEQGYGRSVVNSKIFLEKMDENQVAEAKRRANQWKPKVFSK